MKHTAKHKPSISTPTKKARKGAQPVPKSIPRSPTLAIHDAMVYTVPQAATVLQVSGETVRLMLKRGELQGRKVGQEWRVAGDMIRAFMGQARILKVGDK